LLLDQLYVTKRETRTMPLFDRVKAQAAQAVQKAQEAGKAGQAKLDDLQAKRRSDSLFRDLGAALYAEHVGRGTPTTSANIERLYGEIAAHEEEHGEASTAPEADASPTSAPTATFTPSDAPASAPMPTANPASGESSL
jgi:hypothetical protein